MGKLSGTILILAGVALAASTFSFSRNPTVANVATPQVRGDAKTAAGPATPAPQGAEAKPAQAEESAAPPPAPPQAKPAPVAPPADTPPPAKPVEPRVTPAGKVIQPPAVRLAETPPRMPVDQAKPAGPPPLAGEGLARELQRHLKRAGCYGGAVTGVWSPPVRRAMKAFTDRANAALPVDQPDQVLLALVESNPQVNCSASCPPGQSAADDGRCLPKALIARAKKEPAAPVKAPAAPAKAPGDAGPAPAAPSALASRHAAPAAPHEGRMALAGPRSDPAARAAPQAGAQSLGGRTGNGARHRRPQNSSRYAETRQRRYYDYRAPYEYRGSAPFGFPWWSYRAFGP